MSQLENEKQYRKFRDSLTKKDELYRIVECYLKDPVCCDQSGKPH
jgi:hypothetical protein